MMEGIISLPRYVTILFINMEEIRFSFPDFLEHRYRGLNMNDPNIYWYEVRVVIGSDVLQKYLFKSDHLYEAGDIIKKRYDSGAVAKLIIVHPFGAICPENVLREMSYRSCRPPILSEI